VYIHVQGSFTFDLGLIAIDSASMDVLLSPPLIQSSYGELARMKRRVPQEDVARPSVPAIDHHRAWTGL